MHRTQCRFGNVRNLALVGIVPNHVFSSVSAVSSPVFILSVRSGRVWRRMLRIRDPAAKLGFTNACKGWSHTYPALAGTDQTTLTGRRTCTCEPQKPARTGFRTKPSDSYSLQTRVYRELSPQRRDRRQPASAVLSPDSFAKHCFVSSNKTVLSPLTATRVLSQ